MAPAEKKKRGKVQKEIQEEVAVFTLGRITRLVGF